MELIEQKLKTLTSYHGVIVNVRLDEARLPDGSTAKREGVEHPGGVTVLPLEPDGTVWCVRQYRYPRHGLLLELPAGKIELGEDTRECGNRELQEECGCTADRFEKLAQLYPTPAYCTEVIHIYRASGLHESVQKLDDGEFLDVLRIPFAQAVQMVMDGEISDAKTQIGILKLHLMRQAEGK